MMRPQPSPQTSLLETLPLWIEVIAGSELHTRRHSTIDEIARPELLKASNSYLKGSEKPTMMIRSATARRRGFRWTSLRRDHDTLRNTLNAETFNLERIIVNDH
jgi:hypothetical protein